MDRIYDYMSCSPLFIGIPNNDYDKALKCLDAQISSYSKGKFVFTKGEVVDFLGVVHCGKVKVIGIDEKQHHIVLGELSKGQIFAENYACFDDCKSSVSLECSEDCEILMLNYHKVLNDCKAGCKLNNILTRNILNIIAKKNLMLSKQVTNQLY